MRLEVEYKCTVCNPTPSLEVLSIDKETLHACTVLRRTCFETGAEGTIEGTIVVVLWWNWWHYQRHYSTNLHNRESRTDCKGMRFSNTNYLKSMKKYLLREWWSSSFATCRIHRVHPTSSTRCHDHLQDKGAQDKVTNIMNFHDATTSRCSKVKIPLRVRVVRVCVCAWMWCGGGCGILEIENRVWCGLKITEFDMKFAWHGEEEGIYFGRLWEQCSVPVKT